MKTKLIIALIIMVGVFSGCGNTTTVDDDIVDNQQESQIKSDSNNEENEISIPDLEEDNINEYVEEIEIPILDDPDFRNIKFGMTKEEVLLHESAKLLGEELTVLEYDVPLVGKPARLIYVFNSNGELFQAVYEVLETYIEPNQYIITYNLIKDAYIEVYGEPDNPSSEAWIDPNSLYRRTEDLGRALRLGHLAFVTEWTKDNMKVGMVLSSNDGVQFPFGVIYTSNEFQADSQLEGI